MKNLNLRTETETETDVFVSVLHFLFQSEFYGYRFACHMYHMYHMYHMCFYG